jgi:orotidine-5'-phosphate decarboxylase
MTREQIYELIRKKQSFLCLGLDTEMSKLPNNLLEEEFPMFAFNRALLDATHDLIIACKPNVAFYESQGTDGWKQFELTVNYLKYKYPDILIIADAKRGDIGNTSKKYAETFFKQLPCDAVTVAPYMGSDSVLPFLEYPDKWVVLLALTSNQGADDFQMTLMDNGERLFETVLRKSSEWGNPGNMMFVVGATRASMLKRVRELVPDHFLLIPGVGAQGGDLREVAKYGLNSQCGLIVNSSRAIIYADSSTRYALVAREKAKEMQAEMAAILKGIL